MVINECIIEENKLVINECKSEENKLEITINDFLSLKKVEFKLMKGISVIAGLNGSGKSQLLLGLWQNTNKGNDNLESYGFPNGTSNLARNKIVIKPVPACVLYRPAIRKLAEDRRNSEYANLQPISDYINVDKGYGYKHSIDNRFTYIHSIITNYYIGGTLLKGTDEDKKAWDMISERFYGVFEKTLDGSGSSKTGFKVGIQLSKEDITDITSLNSLSTGELEFISLLSDLLMEHETNGDISKTSEAKKADVILIDELDAHFHPDLQSKIIDNIKDLCSDKYVVITSHSPSVMFSVDREHLFYLEKAERAVGKNNEQLNQISSIANDSDLFKRIAEMYSTFFTDVKLANFMRDDNKYAIQKFADECLREPAALEGEDGKPYDPQITGLRTLIASKEWSIVLEVGCGKGRTLAMFKDIKVDNTPKKQYIGVDIDKNNLDEAKEYAKLLGIDEKLLSFKLEKEYTDINKNIDICIFANVLHEFGAEIINDTLTKYLRCVKPGGSVVVLECLELAVGESNFVMFDPEAIEALFAKCIENGSITNLSKATPETFSKRKLMEVHFIVKEPEKISIDVVSALNKVIEIEKNKLLSHRNHSKELKGVAYAFAVTNLANAIIGLDDLVDKSR